MSHYELEPSVQCEKLQILPRRETKPGGKTRRQNQETNQEANEEANQEAKQEANQGGKPEGKPGESTLRPGH